MRGWHDCNLFHQKIKCRKMTSLLLVGHAK
jgi:hypothetical protein